MKKLFALILTLAVVIPSFGQLHKSNNYWTVGGMIKTNGIGLSSNSVFLSKENKSYGWSLDITTLNHFKEVKIVNPDQLNPQPYSFGKLNRAIQINPSYQYEVMIGRSSRQGPALSYGFDLGPSFALTRPVYLLVQHFTQDENVSPVIEKYRPELHSDFVEILGDAGWEKGFKHMSLKTGIHFDMFLSVDWDKDYLHKRLKTGIAMDYYFQDLNIIYQNQNTFFASFFASYQLGSN